MQDIIHNVMQYINSLEDIYREHHTNRDARVVYKAIYFWEHFVIL